MAVSGALEDWANMEREFIRDELKWFQAGAKLLSPSGDDITAKKMTDLKARLEHAKKVLREADTADRT